jgi:YkoY family integral membrane protein
MFGQRFQLGDIGTVGFLVLLEALLSADNALVLAILVRHLPKDQQKQALLYGLGGAFALRTVAILLAAFIINFWWLQLLGALYLLYLTIKHFVDSKSDGDTAGKKKMGFWATVVYLNFVDLAFAIDSVIVAVAVVDTVKHQDKIWVVIAGAIIGIVILRFAANYFIRILEKYPALDHVAYSLVGWAGVKLLFISGHSVQRLYHLPFAIPEMPPLVFWSGMALIAIGGSFLAMRHPESKPLADEQREASELLGDRELDGSD